MHPYDIIRMPAGDRAPALRQAALRHLQDIEAIEAEFAARLKRRRRILERLARLAKHHRVDLPEAVAARLHP